MNVKMNKQLIVKFLLLLYYNTVQSVNYFSNTVPQIITNNRCKKKHPLWLQNVLETCKYVNN